MRTRRGGLCGLVPVLLAIGLLASGGAASAASLPFSATFSVELSTFPPVTATATGVLSASAPGLVVNSFSVPSGAISAIVVTPISPTLPLLPPFVTLTGVSAVALNATGAFAGGGGTMGIVGAARLLLHAYSAAATAVVPLDAIGVGGTATAKILNLVPISVIGNGFTTGTAAAVSDLVAITPTTLTRMGGISNFTTQQPDPTSPTAVNHHTVFNLVTPAVVLIPGIGNLAVFGRLEIDIIAQTLVVPEPEALWLIACACAAVAAVRLRNATR